MTHRQFRQRSALPVEWQVHALYSHKSYSRFTLDTQAQLTATAPGTRSSPARWLQQWWARRMRARLMRRFAGDTHDFSNSYPSVHDQIFFATMSELDLSGLSAFLGRHDVGLDCDWHLQFHYPIYAGCEPDYPTQDESLAPLRATFSDALTIAADRRLHFYTTTDHLTVQYNRLGAGGSRAALPGTSCSDPDRFEW